MRESNYETEIKSPNCETLSQKFDLKGWNYETFCVSSVCSAPVFLPVKSDAVSFSPADHFLFWLGTLLCQCLQPDCLPPSHFCFQNQALFSAQFRSSLRTRRPLLTLSLPVSRTHLFSPLVVHVEMQGMTWCNICASANWMWGQIIY